MYDSKISSAGSDDIDQPLIADTAVECQTNEVLTISTDSEYWPPEHYTVGKVNTVNNCIVSITEGRLSKRVHVPSIKI